MWSQVIGKKLLQSLIVEKNNMCWRGYNVPKNTLTGRKRNGATFCGLMKAKLFFLGLGATDSLSDDPQTLNSSLSSLKTEKHGGASIMIRGCYSYCGVKTIHHIPRIMDPFGYIKILEEIMLPFSKQEMFLKCVFQQDNNLKHTSKQQHLGSKPTWLKVECSVQFPDLNLVENCGVTSRMLFLRHNQDIQRNCGM